MTQIVEASESRIGRLASACVTVAGCLVASTAISMAVDSELATVNAEHKAPRVASPSPHFKPDHLALAVHEMGGSHYRLIPALHAAELDMQVKEEDERTVEGVLSVMATLKARLQIAQRLILSPDASKASFEDHPFDTMSEVMSACFKEMVKIKNASELSESDEALFFTFAENLALVKQNARLIKQAVRKPAVFRSEIDRDGLVMLAKVGQEASARFSA